MKKLLQVNNQSQNIDKEDILNDNSTSNREVDRKMLNLSNKINNNEAKDADISKTIKLIEKNTFDNDKFASMIEHTLILLNQLKEDFGRRVVDSAKVLLDVFSKFNYSIFERTQITLSYGGHVLNSYFDNIEDTFQNELYEARWFPHAINTDNLQLFLDVSGILEHTRKSKNRIKKLDSLFLNFYDKRHLINLKREWKNNSEIPYHVKKILSQAVDAYNRKEYALTNSALMTLWEGIIATKAGKENNYRISGATRQSLETLNDENNNGETIKKFCNDFIFYDCRKIDDVKEDVPGRHGIAHSWYDKYPSRKAALNAIIFTDFILSLKPITCIL